VVGAGLSQVGDPLRDAVVTVIDTAAADQRRRM
jgi:hypothetical protein